MNRFGRFFNDFSMKKCLELTISLRQLNLKYEIPKKWRKCWKMVRCHLKFISMILRFSTILIKTKYFQIPISLRKQILNFSKLAKWDIFKLFWYNFLGRKAEFWLLLIQSRKLLPFFPIFICPQLLPSDPLTTNISVRLGVCLIPQRGGKTAVELSFPLPCPIY